MIGCPFVFCFYCLIYPFHRARPLRTSTWTNVLYSPTPPFANTGMVSANVARRRGDIPSTCMSAAVPRRCWLSFFPFTLLFFFSQRQADVIMMGFPTMSRSVWRAFTSFSETVSKPQPQLQANSFLEKFVLRSPIYLSSTFQTMIRFISFSFAWLKGSSNHALGMVLLAYKNPCVSHQSA